MTGVGTPVSSLAGDLKVIKAALLYADRVEWTSPKVTLLEWSDAILRDPDMSAYRNGLARMLSKLDRHMARGPAEEFDYSPEPIDYSPEPWVGHGRAGAWRGAYNPVAEEVLAKFLDQPEFQEILAAEDDGVLVLHPVDVQPALLLEDLALESSGVPARPSAQSDAIDAATELLATVVMPSEMTFPLFDEPTGRVLRTLIEGSLPVTDLTPATHAHLAGHFVGTLDAFPDATVAEILDVRRALAEPLIRFRAAVTSIAQSLAVTPLDARFPRIADDRYREHVAPALLELEELTREGRIREQLWRQTVSGKGLPELKTALAMGAAAYALLPHLGAAAAAAAGAAGSALLELATSIGSRRLEIGAQKRTNKFLFLYEAGQRLDRRHTSQ
jgi:hypothetical protein